MYEVLNNSFQTIYMNFILLCNIITIPSKSKLILAFFSNKKKPQISKETYFYFISTKLIYKCRYNVIDLISFVTYHMLNQLWQVKPYLKHILILILYFTSQKYCFSCKLMILFSLSVQG